jgi:hypothetical protein
MCAYTCDQCVTVCVCVCMCVCVCVCDSVDFLPKHNRQAERARWMDNDVFFSGDSVNSTK